MTLKTHSQILDVTIRFPTGHYQDCSLFHTLNKAISDHEDQDDVKYGEMNRELAFMLGFTVHAKHGPERVPILKERKFWPNTSTIFQYPFTQWWYFLCLDIIDLQAIGDITAPLLRTLPVMHQDEIVHEIQFRMLYHFTVQTKAFNQLIPSI